MNHITFIDTKWEEIVDLYTDYFDELGHKNDGFHCGMMYDGTPYIIKYKEEIVGFISIGTSWDKGNMLRGFYVIPAKRRYSKDIFHEACLTYEIEAALVASNDALYISLAFERMNVLKTTFDMQAYNFIYGEPVRDAEFGLECLKEVMPCEYQVMNELTDKQWEGCFDNGTFTFYKIVKDGEILGYGGIGILFNSKKYVDVGNFTLPLHRKKGVGRSMIINLSKIAFDKGVIPVAGCWYGNKESVATLSSSGYIPENRIFYVRYK